MRTQFAHEPVDPDECRAHASTATRRGDTRGAVDWLKRATALAPESQAVRYELGCALLLDRQFAEAGAALGKAVECEPVRPEIWHHLALAFRGQQRSVDAKAAFERALELGPIRGETLALLAETLQSLGDLPAAQRRWREALSRSPGLLPAYLGLGRALMEQGKTDEEIELLREGIAAMPQAIVLWLCLANANEDAGDASAAEAAYRRALALSPGNGTIIGRILKLLGASAESQLISDAHIIVQGSGPDAERAVAGYGLGKALDDRGETAAAFRAWRLANEARRREAGPFDPAELRERVDRLVATFDSAFFAARKGWGHASPRPVFVVGMPRSGTTLVEQLIAAHPLGAGVGELTAISMLARRQEGRVGDLAAGAIAELGEEYLGVVAQLAVPSAQRVVDKQPTNFFHLGLISLLLPHARLVWCRRDMRDAGLSMYAEDMAPSQRHATDLDDIAVYCGEHERLMQHWRRSIPAPIIEVQYEALVQDPEREGRRLMEKIGLEWHPACLAFHNRRRSVNSPSRWQVRRPIHSQSVARWRRYAEWLGPLLEPEVNARGSSG